MSSAQLEPPKALGTSSATLEPAKAYKGRILAKREMPLYDSWRCTPKGGVQATRSPTYTYTFKQCKYAEHREHVLSRPVLRQYLRDRGAEK